jgi:hypothetical protein
MRNGLVEHVRDIGLLQFFLLRLLAEPAAICQAKEFVFRNSQGLSGINDVG